MDIKSVAKRLDGLQTVASMARNLQVKRSTAINYAWRLRKSGHLERVYGGRTRLYHISPEVKGKEGYSFYDILNKNAKVKISAKEDYIIHADRKPGVEEVLARAVASGRFRIVLASLGLFRRVRNWPQLAYFARKYRIERKVGALYELARKTMKVRRMDERTKQGLLRGKGSGYIIERVKTKDFKDVERKWSVAIPFNRADLEVYKE
ncbi:MAG TPA: hypothetical protein VJC16_04785 [Candidatus Nanoarchaeia archaeon]|nr:hypothetical protein [Candidatus Nanoarchaeia archaeon]